MRRDEQKYKFLKLLLMMVVANLMYFYVEYITILRLYF